MSDVALVFNGHARTFFEHITSIKKNIIDVCDCDVLISTWDVLDGGYSQLIKDQALSDKQKYVLENVPNLVALEINKNDQHNDVKNIRGYFRKNQIFKAHPMFISAGLFARKLSSNLLKSHEAKLGKKYKTVISLTMDVCIRTPIQKSLLETSGTLYIPHPSQIAKKGLAINGRVVFGDRETMNFWLDMYDDIELYAKQTDQHVVLMENIVCNAITKNNIHYANNMLSYDIRRLAGRPALRYLHDKIPEFYVSETEPCSCIL